MKEYQQKYCELYQFIGGYFHQDWRYDYDLEGGKPEIEKVVRHYKSEVSENILKKTISEMESLLSENLNEKELRKVLMEIGNSHYAPDTHGTYKKFLEKILEVLKEPNNSKALKRIA